MWKGLILLSVITVIGLVILREAATTSRPEPPQSPDRDSLPSAVPLSGSARNTWPSHERPKLKTDTLQDPRFRRYEDGSVESLSSLEISEQLYRSNDPHEDLRIIDQLLGDYRGIFKENPVGSLNQEITAQLLGHNRMKIIFVSRDIEAFNSDLEILDRWGSPIVFHPLSSQVLGLHSLGPDRQLWTDDDLSLDTSEIERSLGL